MNSELNKKIVDIIDKSTYEDYSLGADDNEVMTEYVDKQEAANEIEILVLNEKIELLIKYRDEFMNRFLTSSAASLNREIDIIYQQLNQLKQSS